MQKRRRIAMAGILASAAVWLTVTPAHALTYTAHPHIISDGYATYNTNGKTLKVCDTKRDGRSIVAVIIWDGNESGYVMSKGKGRCETHNTGARSGAVFKLRVWLADNGDQVPGSYGAPVYGDT